MPGEMWGFRDRGDGTAENKSGAGRMLCLMNNDCLQNHKDSTQVRTLESRSGIEHLP